MHSCLVSQVAVVVGTKPAANYVLQDRAERATNAKSAVPMEVLLKEKLNKFTNAVNSCEFSSECEYLVAAGRYVIGFCIMRIYKTRLKPAEHALEKCQNTLNVFFFVFIDFTLSDYLTRSICKTRIIPLSSI